MWVTTKTGKRVNTDWFDEERKKEQQIARNKQEADKASGKSQAQQIHDLMGQDAYVNSPEYMEAMDEYQSVEKEREKLKARMHELWDIKEKGSTISDEDLKQFDGDRALAKLFAKKSPEAEAAEEELKKLYKREDELNEKRDKALAKLQKLDRVEAERQKAQFDADSKAGKLTMTKQSQKEYNGFELDTHTTHYQELQKKGEATIMEMSPKEYLQRCAVDIFDSTYERQVRAAEADASHTFELVEMMRQGTKMYLPVLNYAEKEQEGRHRAVAAMLMGIDKIPVLVVPRKRK